MMTKRKNVAKIQQTLKNNSTKTECMLLKSNTHTSQEKFFPFSFFVEIFTILNSK